MKVALSVLIAAFFLVACFIIALCDAISRGNKAEFLDAEDAK